jgi:hypothetical protein
MKEVLRRKGRSTNRCSADCSYPPRQRREIFRRIVLEVTPDGVQFSTIALIDVVDAREIHQAHTKIQNDYPQSGAEEGGLLVVGYQVSYDVPPDHPPLLLDV